MGSTFTCEVFTPGCQVKAWHDVSFWCCAKGEPSWIRFAHPGYKNIKKDLIAVAAIERSEIEGTQAVKYGYGG